MFFRETSHGFFSDSRWKCSLEERSAWFTSTFDDSSWPEAVTQEDDAYYTHPDFLANFNSQARTIWAQDAEGQTVFCRRRICHSKTA